MSNRIEQISDSEKALTKIEISTWQIIKELAFGKSESSSRKRIWNFVISGFFLILLALLILSLFFKWHYISYNQEHYFMNRNYEIVTDTINGIAETHGQWNGPKPEDDPYFIFGKGVGVDRYIRELDIAGLLGGFIGIFVGLFITVIIEKQNRVKQVQSDIEMSELKKAVTKLENTSTKIDESVVKIDSSISRVVKDITQIVERDNKFFPTETLEKVLAKIEEIVIQSLNDSTDLMIMNHSSSFGYLLTFKVKTVLNTIKDYKIETIENITFKEYFKAFEKIKFIQEQVFKNLRDRGESIIKGGNKVIYVTLDPNKNGGTTTPYVNNYLTHIMKDAEIVVYNEYSMDCLTELSSKTPFELEKYYFIPDSIISKSDEDSQDDLKSKFLKYLVDRQRNEIIGLRAEGIIVKEVEEIPIQVYLSDLKDAKGTCLFMFVNHQTIGKSGHNLVAFASKNEPYIINSFKSIIEKMSS